jgi:hypothetical protein
MTFEELKAEASRQGYSLTKKITYAKLKPCVCGSKKIYQDITVYPKTYGKYYYCSNCKRKSEIAKSWYQARDNWNKFVEENSQNTKKTLDNHDC